MEVLGLEPGDLEQARALAARVPANDLDGLYRACGNPAGRDGKSPQYCDACFSGDYPVDPSDARASGKIREVVRA